MRLELPTVTLCAVTSVNVAATMEALRASLAEVAFGDAVMLTDAEVSPINQELRVAPIERLKSAKDYSEFILRELASYVTTDYCLIVQWDGFVIGPREWRSSFLDYDYIGAPWPQFPDGNNVGNGGFSLRSKRLLEASRDPAFKVGHPEDVAICRKNRDWLEREHGIRFAPVEHAGRFSFERGVPVSPTFGFHGIFNLIPLLGADRFWEIYETLDDKATVRTDAWRLVRQLGSGRKAMRRRLQLIRSVVKSGRGQENGGAA